MGCCTLLLNRVSRSQNLGRPCAILWGKGVSALMWWWSWLLQHGYVFIGPTGRPINLRADNREWAKLLKQIAVEKPRLHDARHIAATVLLVPVINQRAPHSVFPRRARQHPSKGLRSGLPRDGDSRQAARC